MSSAATVPAMYGKLRKMPHTIRQQLDRRTRRAGIVAGILWVGLLAMMIFMHTPAMLPWFLVGFAAFGGTALYAVYARCPKCRAVLGHCVVGRMHFKRSRLFARPNFCPYCGVSFDEPCSQG